MLCFIVAAHGVRAAAIGEPYVPAHDDTVLQRVPATSDPRVRRFERLAASLKRQPDDRSLALRLSRAYIDYARSTGDARFLGRALIPIQRWREAQPMPVDVMIVHATVLQSRHQFDAARTELEQALARAPGNAQGWLTLATVDMVQGRFADARAHCVHTANTGGQYLAIVCNGELLSLTGHADRAYRLLQLIQYGGPQVPVDVRAYVEGLLAEAAARTERPALAGKHYRRALQYAPGDNFLLADYGDFLLDQNRPADALALVKGDTASDTSFLRLVLAKAALERPDTAKAIRTMAARFNAMAARDSHVYRREQARFVLELQHDPERALKLAQQNWTVQRAPKDVRIFLAAALAAGRPAAARPGARFSRTHRYARSSGRSARSASRRSLGSVQADACGEWFGGWQGGLLNTVRVLRHAAMAAGLSLAVLMFLASTSAQAHKESDAYLTLRSDNSDAAVLDGQWDIALRDLNFALGIDGNRDGAITWGEVKAHRGVIERYALARLTIAGDGLDCPLRAYGQKIDVHTDGEYVVILFRADCHVERPNALTIDYRLFSDVDPYHRGIVTVHADGHTANAVLGADRAAARLSLATPDRWRQFTSFAGDGIWHIWLGFDHMLFILSLLLPAVLVRRSRDQTNAAKPAALDRWQPVARLAPAVVEILKVVSAFTVAHSITLTLAVLGFVDLPSRLVESGIALSIVIAALNNIVPLVQRRVWLLAFGFGLIHGLGFASALAGLDLPPAALAASLGGFNVGVEIGQAAVVLAVMPLAFAVRRTRFYRQFVLRWGSAVIIVIATGWFIQRAFAVAIPIFGDYLPG